VFGESAILVYKPLVWHLARINIDPPRWVLLFARIERTTPRSDVRWLLCSSTHGSNDVVSLGGPPDDAVLRGDHRQRRRLELGEVALRGVLYQDTLVPAVVRFPHGGLHAHLLRAGACRSGSRAEGLGRVSTKRIDGTRLMAYDW